MIIRNIEDIRGTEMEVEAPSGNWMSRRLLTRKDGMGFSLNDTVIRGGTETYIWYKYHLEAVYCVSGRGEIEDLEKGRIIPIKEGVMYALNNNEKHYLRAHEDMRLICVFNPPLSGNEVHTEEGFYPPPDDTV